MTDFENLPEGICKGIGGTGSILASGTICAPFVSGVTNSVLLLATSIILASLVRNFIARKFSDRNSKNTETGEVHHMKEILMGFLRQGQEHKFTASSRKAAEVCLWNALPSHINS